ncbi:YdgA family protein [Serratia microhaemolytica]|uniref:YdgA family protein n=1 Tax=Serratia microhaemolytica TaxID=2675110 RepID=UPI000FDF5AF3|nr:YdgA family protein [Serratia microhaemolytica]
MKKSLVAVGVIAALGVIWTGAAWYTGKQLQQRLPSSLQQLNQQLTAQFPGANLAITVEDYQRGVFSSKMRHVLHISSAGRSDKQTVSFLTTVDHGPFPQSELKRFNLLPSMAAAHSTLENTPYSAGVFRITKGESPFTLDSRFSYGQTMAVRLNIIPLNLGVVNFSGTKINVDGHFAKKTGELKFNLNTAGFELRVSNGEDVSEQILLKGLEISNNTVNGAFGLPVGKQSIALKQLSVTRDGAEKVAIDNLNVTGVSRETGDTLSTSVDYNIAALKVDKLNVGAMKLALQFDNLDGSVLKTVLAAIDEYKQDEMMDEVSLGAVLSEQINANLPQLLKRHPSISIKPFNWKNSQGESSFNMNLVFQPVAEGDTSPVAFIKQIDSNLAISMPMAKEAMAQITQLQGHTAEDSRRFAEHQVDLWTGTAQVLQMIQFDTQKQKITSQLNYKDGVANLNGSEMTLEELTKLFSK